MFRNSYDTDVITWSPQGRLHQVRFFFLLCEGQARGKNEWRSTPIELPSFSFSLSFRSLAQKIQQVEYAIEAVKQGSAAVGLKVRERDEGEDERKREMRESFSFFRRHGNRSRVFFFFLLRPRPHSPLSLSPSLSLSPPPSLTLQLPPQSSTHAVLAALKRAPSELASHQPKVFKVDDHLGVAVSGLVSDGRSLLRSMRSQCASHRFVYECGLAPGRLVRALADRAQIATQRSWKRPLGVGLLVAGWCEQSRKPALHYLCPSGSAHSYRATAIGARAQAAKTLLEREVETYGAAGTSADELVRAGLRALAATLAEGELDSKNATVAVVGEGTPFTVLEGEDLVPFLEAIAGEGGDAAAAAEAPVEETAAEGGEGGEGNEGGGGGGGNGDEPPPPAPMDT